MPDHGAIYQAPTKLDERFHLPAGTRQALPQYKEYGFAVFKLNLILPQAHCYQYRIAGRRSSAALWLG